MFRFSVRGLAIYIAFVAMTLALTRVNSWLGAMWLWLTSALASSLLAPRTYRFAAWGGWLGFVLLFPLFCLSTPNPYSGTTRDQLREWSERGDHQRATSTQLGVLIGVTVGLLLERRRAAG